MHILGIAEPYICASRIWIFESQFKKGYYSEDIENQKLCDFKCLLKSCLQELTTTTA